MDNEPSKTYLGWVAKVKGEVTAEDIDKAVEHESKKKSTLEKMWCEWLEGKVYPALFAVLTASLAGGVAYILHLINN